MSNATKARHSPGVIILVKFIQVKELIFIFLFFFVDFEVFFRFFPIFYEMFDCINKKVLKYKKFWIKPVVVFCFFFLKFFDQGPYLKTYIRVLCKKCTKSLIIKSLSKLCHYIGILSIIIVWWAGQAERINMRFQWSSRQL